MTDTRANDSSGADTAATFDLSSMQTSGTLVERMEIEILAADASTVTASMPVHGNTQPYGLLHGGASVVLAETVGSILAATLAGPGRIAVGIDINATHHRAVRSGTVTGTATVLSAGRSVVVTEIVITDQDGARVCTSRLTCALRDRPPGG